MEITDVTAVTVEVPLRTLDEPMGIGPYVTNHGELTSVERVLVRVRTDAGITGWGEMRVFLSPTATESVIEDGIGPLVVGRSPFAVEGLRRQVFVEYAAVDQFFAPIETACWDIIGKELDRPVYELLGGWTAPEPTAGRHRLVANETTTSHQLPFAFCLGICSLDRSREKAQQALDQGFRVLKTKAGRDWHHDIDRLVAMDEVTNGTLEFRLDPNQGWTPDEALRVASALDDADVDVQYLEQPIRTNMHAQLAGLRRRTRLPIAPNEDTYIPHNIQSLVEHDALDVAVLDLTPAGGISGLRQQVAITEAAGIPAVHHCAFDLGVRTAAIAHAVHGLVGFSLPSDTTYYSWADNIITDPFEFDAGCLSVPDDPGLGVTVDLDAVDRLSL